jgi:CRP-like cAMP-binding protein
MATSENRLLARLTASDHERVLPLLRLVPLKFEHVLSEQRSKINYVYFPCRGVVSAITVMNNGTLIEVATVGNEGMVGLMAMHGAEESPHRQLVQVHGEAFRMGADAFRAEIGRVDRFQQMVVRYNTAFQYQMSQAVACNGLHTIPRRCCRWILQTQDRAVADEFPLTHEFLSHMLGVRRVSVTDVLKPLQEAGLITTHRGWVTVLDRKGLEKASCECYQTLKDEFDRLLG